jgi:hypothetical protein
MTETTTETTTATPAPATAPAQESKMDGTVLIILLVFLGIWLIAHVWAIIKSLLCFGKSGTLTERIFGFVLAFFMGPLYFIYLYADKEYCNDVPTMPIAPIGGRRK